MAAPTLCQKQKSATARVKANKNVKTKTVMCESFSVRWPVVSEATADEIRTKLRDTIAPLGLIRQKVPFFRGKDKTQARQRAKEDRDAKWTDEQTDIRHQLVIGINAVTRCLEQDRLRALLVDQGTQPAILTKHLIELSGVRQCAAMHMPGVRETLGPLLGLQSLTVVGFRKKEPTDSDKLDTLVNVIQERAAKIHISWLKPDETCDNQIKAESPDDDNQIEPASVVSTNHSLQTVPSHPNISQQTVSSGPKPKEIDVKKRETSTEIPNSIASPSSSDVKRQAKKKPDFSHLYIYRKESVSVKKESFDNGSNCLEIDVLSGAFCDDTSHPATVVKSEAVQSPRKVSRKRKTSTGKTSQSNSGYLEPNIGILQADTDRENRKSKKIKKEKKNTKEKKIKKVNRVKKEKK